MKALHMVVLGLVAFGGGYGGWRLWTSQRAARNAAPAPAEGWCAEHRIAQADCPFCNKALLEERGECREHGVPEAACVTCKPALAAAFDVAKERGDWCGGHSLPEALCVKCNPALLAARVPARPSPAAQGDVTVESIPADELPRTRRAPSPTCNVERVRVRLASPEIARRVGFAVERIARKAVRDVVTVQAETAFDATRYARAVPRSPGILREVRKDVGDAVEAGDVLAVVEAPEVGAAKAEILQTRALVALWEKNAARERGLVERGLASERESIAAQTRLAEAEIALSGATQRLRTLGATADDVAAVLANQDRSPLVALTAPARGTVVEREAVVGETVDASRALFAVADTSSTWAHLDASAADAVRMRAGQAVVLEVDGLRGERFAGRVTWVSPSADSATRTVRVRAQIRNDEGRLRAGQFGRAFVTVRDGEPSLVVPKAAVQWEGDCNVAFVRRSEVLFEPRKLRLGAAAGEYLVVEEGLAEGEEVVTQGSFLLRTEVRKDSIGAGCCDGE
jgi:cobalt-zinc-cadmium efflux system membrane fusion protein